MSCIALAPRFKSFNIYYLSDSLKLAHRSPSKQRTELTLIFYIILYFYCVCSLCPLNPIDWIVFTVDSDCGHSDQYCFNRKCYTKVAAGASCTEDNQCSSNHCDYCFFGCPDVCKDNRRGLETQTKVEESVEVAAEPKSKLTEVVLGFCSLLYFNLSSLCYVPSTL